MYSIQTTVLRRFSLQVAGLILLAALPLRAQQASFVGTWSATLDSKGAPVPIVVHVEPANATSLTGSFDSPTHAQVGFPIYGVTQSGNKVDLTLAKGMAWFAGTMSADGQSITGFWHQETSQQITFHRVAEPTAAPERPQTPKPPFPYRSEDVSYASGDATIAATLTVPEGAGPFPAVLLIAGSGPQDRDEALLGHKPFLVLADYLSRHGIAVLRADKRGIGKSTGEARSATLEDYAADATAGLAFLRAQSDVDPRRVGLLGHSEGGEVAPMVAAKMPTQVAFVVLLAAPGLPGKDIVVAQTEMVSKASGIQEEVAYRSREQEQELLDAVLAQPNSAKLHLKLYNMLKDDGLPDARIPASIDLLTSAPYRFFLTFDPAHALEQVRCPVLALGGSKDTQVAAAQNLSAIRKALALGGNTHVTTQELTGLNHLFQTAKTGSPNEYAQIAETMAPAATEEVAAWIVAQPAHVEAAK